MQFFFENFIYYIYIEQCSSVGVCVLLELHVPASLVTVTDCSGAVAGPSLFSALTLSGRDFLPINHDRPDKSTSTDVELASTAMSMFVHVCWTWSGAAAAVTVRVELVKLTGTTTS